MVKQGTPEEEKVGSVPSGGKEANETLEECCIREIQEETGYEVIIILPLFVKSNDDVEVHYFILKWEFTMVQLTFKIRII